MAFGNGSGFSGGRRNVAIYGALALTVATIAGVVAYSRASDSQRSEERAALRFLIERTVPGMCTMQERLAANDRGGAFNVFYDEVHTGAHALEAALLEDGSADLAAYLRAKSRVESDLRTLSPTLKESVATFATALHSTLDLYDSSVWKPC